VIVHTIPPDSGTVEKELYAPALAPTLSIRMTAQPLFVGYGQDPRVEEDNGWWADLWAIMVDGSPWYHVTN
jgi:hypothetical protein